MKSDSKSTEDKAYNLNHKSFKKPHVAAVFCAENANLFRVNLFLWNNSKPTSHKFYRVIGKEGVHER